MKKSIRIFPTRCGRLSSLLAIVLSCLVARCARAGNAYWFGTNGVAITTNWSDTLNWSSSFPGYTAYSPVNNAANFTYANAANAPGLTTVYADGAGSFGGAAPGPNAWSMVFGQTNGYHTVVIADGVTLFQEDSGGGTGNGLFVSGQGAGNGSDGSTVNTARFPSGATNYTTIKGLNGTLFIGNTIHIGEGSTGVGNYYAILDMSGLGTFVETNFTGNANRFLLCNAGPQRVQGACYLANTNIILLGNDLQIGWESSYSNSLPIALYLGQTNYVLTGMNGSGNQIVVGYNGCTNALMAFRSGLSAPVASFASLPSVNGGRVGNFWLCNNNGARAPGSATCDFTGGTVSILASTMQLAQSGTASPYNSSAFGALTFNNGTVDATTVILGNQTASSGSPAVGILTVNSNATLHTSGTLLANTVALGVVTGTATGGTAGTLTVNGGTLVANLVTNGGGTATLNLTNATLGLQLSAVAQTNVVVSTLNLGGTTNILNLTSITPFLGSGYPVRFHLIKPSTLNGTYNLGLGTLPSSYDPATNYSGYLDTTSAPPVVDFVLTGGPAASRVLTWSGLTNGVADGDWDVQTTPNWVFTGGSTFFNQFDVVTFTNTSSGATNINLAAVLTPFSLTVSNTTSLYTFGGGGKISGAVALSKQGSGTLVLDENSSLGQGYNDFSGGIVISGGTVQAGNGDGNGTLGSGGVVDNGTLVFNHGANATLAAVISGSGSVIQMGGDTLTLSGANTFTNTLVITNDSVLALGNTSAMGTTNGATVIANGSTLDMNAINGGNAALEPILVQGAGVGGAGAIVNNNSASGVILNRVTLLGDTTLGGTARSDLTGTLSSGGHPYNVTILGSSYHEWNNLTADANLSNVTVTGSAELGYKGATTLGNSTATLEVTSGAILTFWQNGNVTLNKRLVLDDGSVLHNGDATTTIQSPVVLTNSSGSGYCAFNVGGTSLTINGALSGNGILYKLTGSSPLILNANSSAFTGGAYVTGGKLVLNGILGCGLTNTAGALVAGTGTNNGPVDIGGTLAAGDAGAVGTFTVAGGLTLEPGAVLTNDLSAVSTGNNDLIRVTGDLTVNNNDIYINPVGATLESGRPYTLITYTGNLNGTLGNVATVTATPYTLVLSNATSLSPKQIQVIVTGGQPSSLVWNNAQGDGEWNVQGSQNWSNLTTHVSPDSFVSLDTVLLDDSITNAPIPTNVLDIASGVVVSPSVITNNSTTNYAIQGAGKLSGTLNLVKLGSGTLTLSSVNDFSGNITVLGGTLRAWGAGGLGSTTGTITVTNGATLDRGWDAVKPIVVSGSGVGGIGAIVNNSSGNAIYDGAGGLTASLTLAGDTTFGGNTRWDLGGAAGAVLSTGGHNYNLAVNETAGTYMEWQDLTIDTNLGNIDIYTTGGGSLGIKGCGGSLGNPTNTITVHTGSQLTFWGSTTNNSGYAKNIHVLTNGTVQFRPQNPDVYYLANLALDDGAIWQWYNGSGSGTVLLGTAALGGTIQIQVSDSVCTVSNVISGSGGFTFDTGNNILALAGTNTYSGTTLIAGGRTLALVSRGSISGSTNISVAAGATLSASGRLDGTLTLAAGQTLGGNGTVAGNLVVGAGATVSPGSSIGVLTVSNGSITNSGTCLMEIDDVAHTNDQLRATGTNATTIAYGGTLQVVTLAGSLSAGDSFKLFSASNYTGTFTTLVPSAPGPGLLWDTSGLTNGTLAVVSVPVLPPHFGGIGATPTNFTLFGSGGAPDGTYRVFASADLTQPRSNWVQIASGSFDGSGDFSFSVTNNPAEPRKFYLLEVP